MQFLSKFTLKKIVCGSIFVLLLAAFAVLPVFATDAIDADDDSDETVSAQETGGGSYDFSSDEDVLTLKNIDESVYNIDETETPLIELPYVGTWALVNMLMALTSLILSASTVIALMAERAAKIKISDPYRTRKGFVLRYSPAFKFAGAGLGFVSAILFLLTEDVHGAMQPVDESTWLTALMLLVQSGVLFAAFGSEKRFRDIGDM
ncbi:MAG: hypothetical protein LBK57_01340 [Clostridiales Family XIII bacterium]|jgi:hypothetical protein|nr:hypothetical protein [Clostridiales Family XIII bacterium]